MSETNVNAYKSELVIADRELSRANSKVNGLKAYIDSVEGKPKATVVSEEVAAKEEPKAKKDKK